MRSRAFGLVCVLVSAGIALAGCADGGGPAGTETLRPEQLDEGKGAIAGLLIDDRFRPIHLTDDPTNEFQARGQVLLQETGALSRTTTNGEFAFVNLDPGAYTLRVTAAGHEATPAQVTVRAGEFTEISVVARRVSSQGTTIVTEQYAAFASCFVNFVALSARPDCTGDSSGDTARSGFNLNYSGLPDVTWVVAEILFNQDPQNGASFDLVMRREFDYDHSAAVLWEGRYAKMHLVNGGVSPDPVPPGDDFHPWYAANETTTIEMFGRGYLAEEIRTAYEPVYETLSDLPCSDPIYCASHFPMRRGGGVTLGVSATFLISIFLGEPDVDPLAYCALCAP